MSFPSLQMSKWKHGGVRGFAPVRGRGQNPGNLFQVFISSTNIYGTPTRFRFLATRPQIPTPVTTDQLLCHFWGSKEA